MPSSGSGKLYRNMDREGCTIPDVKKGIKDVSKMKNKEQVKKPNLTGLYFISFPPWDLYDDNKPAYNGQVISEVKEEPGKYLLCVLAPKRSDWYFTEDSMENIIFF